MPRHSPALFRKSPASGGNCVETTSGKPRASPRKTEGSKDYLPGTDMAFLKESTVLCINLHNTANLTFFCPIDSFFVRIISFLREIPLQANIDHNRRHHRSFCFSNCTVSFLVTRDPRPKLALCHQDEPHGLIPLDRMGCAHTVTLPPQLPAHFTAQHPTRRPAQVSG